MAEEIKHTEQDSSPLVLVKKTDAEITPDDLAEFEKFVQEELNILESIKDRSSPEFEKQGTAASVHTLAHSLLTISTQTSEGVRAIFAKKDNQLVGYSLAHLDKSSNTVLNTYLGVSSKYQQQGIGAMILDECHKDLKSQGITSYTTYVYDATLKYFDKLGIPYQITPVANPHQTFSKEIKVTLP